MTASQVQVAEYAVSWETPHTPEVQPIGVGMVSWTAVSPEAAMRVVKALMTAAQEARLAKYRTCTMCERTTPPEWMHGTDVCQRCAERELGIVH